MPAVNQLPGSLIGKVLNGATVGELPVERPTRFKLVIILKTAAALGLEVPLRSSLADEVIE
jgi:putative ABC transport system substrate-binding protein